MDPETDAARVAELALAEDGARDISSLVSIAAGQRGRAVIEARQVLVMAGIPYADAVVARCHLPPVEWATHDGAVEPRGRVLGVLQGDLLAVLRAERPLLNLMQRAAGIATLTAQFVHAVAGTRCRILHTRKTTPGLRTFEIAAVLAGGGWSHRRSLADEVMIKDNHWQALTAHGRSLQDALDEARALGVAALQVEVERIDQLDEACAAGATRLLIDNQTPATVAEWTARVRREHADIEIEATGGITLANVRAYAEADVDFISLGALTHSVPSADLGVEVRQEGDISE